MSPFVGLSGLLHNEFVRAFNVWIWVFKYLSDSEAMCDLFTAILLCSDKSSYSRWKKISEETVACCISLFLTYIFLLFPFFLAYHH